MRSGLRLLVLLMAAALVTGTGRAQPQTPLWQSVDATQLRGKLMLFEATVSTQAPNAVLHLRAEVSATHQLTAAQVPVKANGQRARVLLRVPVHTNRLVTGLHIPGGGTGSLSDAALLTVTPEALGFEAPRTLSPQGLTNLAAFTKLLGYVRFFHPSDQAAGADWDSFAIAAVGKIEDAANAEELASRLQAVFAPVAPTLRVAAGPAARAETPSCGGCQHVVWEHRGVELGGTAELYGTSPQRIYESQRVPAGSALAPLRTELDGGISISMPMVLPRDARGTLPHGAPPSPDFGKPARFLPSAEDRATRLAGIALAWGVFQHFYPYFDVVKTDWNAELATALRRAATDADDAAFRQTLLRFVGTLKDGHGTINGPAIVASPPFGWDVIENKLVVTAVHPDDSHGLKPGDIILSINDRDAMAALQTLEPLASGATPQWRRLKALQLLMPNDGVPMRLRVQHEDGRERALEVTRSARPRPREKLPETIAELRPGLWYVDFTRLTELEFVEAIPKLTAAKAIIFDVRHYPTGTARMVVTYLSSRFLRSGRMEIPVAALPDRRGVTFVTNQWNLPPAGYNAPGPELRSRLVLPQRNQRFGGKYVFLTGNDVVSYGESMMGLIADEKLGTIVGEPTAGTNGNVNRFALPGGYTVTFTGMRVTRQDGSALHGVGIKPDYLVPRTIAGLRAGRDEVLEKGIELAAAAMAP